MSRLVAVTGATGFVGQHLVTALARRGWRLRLLIRRWTPLPSLAGVAAEIVLGDLDDDAALAGLLAGADAIIHAAGLIKARAPADFHRVNAQGTARLVTRATKIPFLLLSSLAAREPLLSAYAASKRAAEESLASGAIAVRAPAVYGPGDRETLNYFKAIARGLAPRPRMPSSGRGAARLSLIHVADLVEALALTVDRPPAPGVYEIDDGRVGGYSYAEMAAAAGSALGRVPRTLVLPRPVMSLVAGVNGVLHSLGGAPRILTAGKVNELFHADWTIHDRRLAAALEVSAAFQPEYDIVSGFCDTVAWYRRRRWL